MTGIAATVRAGASLIVDDVLLRGAASQKRWQAVLGDLNVCWIAVHCSAEIAAAREKARPERTPGMHAQQRNTVHQGVAYDLQVDTSALEPLALAQHIRRALKL